MRILSPSGGRPGGRGWVVSSAMAVWLSGCLGPISRAPRSRPVGTPRPPAVVSTHLKKPNPEAGRNVPASVHPSPFFSPPLTTFRVRSPYGQRGRKFHMGLDLIESTNGGDPVFASQAGVVETVTHRGGYGRMILLRHGENGFTRYAHLRKVTVHLGQTVQQGETIGFVGTSGRASGPHLHFEILTPTRKPVDPTPYLFPQGPDTPLARSPSIPPRLPLSPIPVPALQKLK